MSEFSFYMYKEDIAHIEYIFQQWDNIYGSHVITTVFRTAGKIMRQTIWAKAKEGHLSTFDISYVNGKYNHNAATTYRYGNFSERYSAKRNDVREYVGAIRPGGSLMHIFDRGTKERYTKRGYYRGHISRANGINRGHGGYTDGVESAAPFCMQMIMGAIEAFLNIVH